MSKLIRIISGGQTGADRAGLEAARQAGLQTGGTVPRGWRTELGTDLSLRAFGVSEHASPNYPARTQANVIDSDGTLIIAFPSLDGGSELTASFCRRMRKPYLFVSAHSLDNVALIIAKNFIISKNIATLNVAGNRESKSPGLQSAATIWLTELFIQLKERAKVA